MIAGNVLMVFVTVLMDLATFGVTLILVPAMWFAGIVHSAYYASDEHGMHPWLHVWKYRRGKVAMLTKKV